MKKTAGRLGARMNKVRSRVTGCSGTAPAPRWMLLAAFAILALLAATLVYQYMVASAMSKSAYYGGSERFDNSSQYTLVYLYMNGCSWCERFSPQWDALVDTRSAELRQMGVATVKYERSEDGAKIYAADVRGYPTVLLVRPDGSRVKFDGERTPDGIMAFLRGNVAEGFEDGSQGFDSMGKSIKNANKNGSKQSKNVSEQSKGAGKKLD